MSTSHSIEQTSDPFSGDVKKKRKNKTDEIYRKLAALFERKPQNDDDSSLKNSVNSKETKTSKSKSKTEIKTVEKETEVDNERETRRMKDEGFCPPEGIVHETLLAKKSVNKTAQVARTKRKRDDSMGGEAEYKPRIRNKHKRDKVKEDRTVFVGNLPLNVTKSTVKALFREMGKIENLRFRCPPPADPRVPKKVVAIKKDFHPDRKNMVAFVCFEDKSSTTKALELNGHVLNGYHLRVDLSNNSKKHNKHRSAFIGNLSYDMEENAVWDHFEVCGNIENVRIVRDRYTGLGKGFGYVSFQDRGSVDLALRLDNSVLKGRNIRVKRCENVSKKKRKETNPVRESVRESVTKRLPKIGMNPTNIRPGQKRRPRHVKKLMKAKKSKQDQLKKYFS